MKKPKAVIMDLGDTIVRNKEFNFQDGLKYLYEFIIKKISFEDFLKLNNYLKENTYDIRHKSKLENKFLDYLRYLKAIVGFDTSLSLEEIEINFMVKASCDELIEEVLPLLDYFKSNNIPIFILSNSTFSTNAITYQIEKFNVLDYFEEVFSSADYLFRKPHLGIFEVAKSAIVNKYPNISIEDTWFIGNDYQCDIKGASNSNLFPIWYNKYDEKNIDEIKCINIKTYKELLDILQ